MRARPPAASLDGVEGVALAWFMIRAVRVPIPYRRLVCTVACVTCANPRSHRVPPEWRVFL